VSPSAESIKVQLDKILASRAFGRTESLSRLLRYLVEHSTQGHGESLKEYTIGVQALGRPEAFDPRSDPIVRVQARRLRARLEEYYRTEGGTDPVVIELAKGRYVIGIHANGRSESRFRKQIKATGIVCATLLLAAASFWVFTRLNEKQAANQRPAQSIAVLPLRSLSQNPADEYLANGLTEALVTDLSKIGSLRVVSQTSLLVFKDRSKPVKDIARAVHADTIVEGALARSGERVRVTVQLIDAATDRHLWAETYERDMSDVLELQSVLARRIAAEIRIKLSPSEENRLAVRKHVHPDVLRHYVEARYLASQGTGEALGNSIGLYEQALAKDESYAPAWAGLALAHIWLAGKAGSPSEIMPRAKVAALKAVETDDHLADAHTALGWVNLFYDWDWPNAAARIRRAIELNPSSPVAHTLHAVYSVALNQPDQAVAEVLRAQELDPLSLETQALVQMVFFAARNYERAFEVGKKVLERAPDFSFGRALTGLACAKTGRRTEAIQHLQAAVRADDGGYLAPALAHAYALLGLETEAHAALEKVKKVSKSRYVCAYEVASAYAILGESDEAFRWFRKAVEDRSECLVWTRVSPWLDPVRSDRRFEELLRQVGFPK
jgi:TolB-like protein/Tfp pilus assembly protein PilF